MDYTLKKEENLEIFLKNIEEFLGDGKEVNKKNPKVSVVITTYYKKAPYFRECIESILSQKTNFDFEIIIADNSPEGKDESKKICMEYAKKNQDKIRFFEMVNPSFLNFYDEKGKFLGQYYGFKSRMLARGKYIALCEGDDFWIDPLKLQKQFDIMKKNPEISLCFHPVKICDNFLLKNKFIKLSNKNKFLNNNKFLWGIGFLHRKIPTPSMFFIKSAITPTPYYHFKFGNVSDFPIKLSLFLKGKAFYLNEVMAVRRINSKDSWNKETLTKNSKKIVNHYFNMIKGLNYFNKTTKYKYFLEILFNQFIYLIIMVYRLFKLLKNKLL